MRRRRWPTRQWRATRTAFAALLNSGVDVNAAQGDGMTALHWAAIKNDAELAQMLVYAGANVKATTRLGGYTPLVIAARKASAERGRDAAQGRRRCRRRATSTGTTPLMLAAAAGNSRP